MASFKESPNHDGIIGTPSDHGGPGPHIMAADSLTGEKVVNESGDALGHLAHVMLDIHTGQIAYAVLSVATTLGFGHKFIALPWQALALDVDNKWFVLNASRERVEAATGFDKQHWPRVADASWLQPVDGYSGPASLKRAPFI